MWIPIIIPTKTYHNSPNATKKDALGTLLIGIGIYTLLLGVGIVLIIIGIIEKIRAESIAKKEPMTNVNANNTTGSLNGIPYESEVINQPSKLGKTSLIFGIVSILFFPFAIPGLICGIKCLVDDKKKGIKANGKAKAGIILSALTLGFIIIAIISACVSPSKVQKRFDVSEVSGFNVAITESGYIDEKAVSVGNREIILDNHKYTFPVEISHLLGDGWNLSADARNTIIKAYTSTFLVNGCLMTSDGGMTITLEQIVNRNKTNSAKLENCRLQAFYFNCSSSSRNVSFILPGGITEKSTARDILSVYGDPNNSSLFDHGSNTGDTLEYIWSSGSHYNFKFTFNQDGSLKYVRVGSNAYD